MITIELYSFSKRENSTKRPGKGKRVECYLKEDTSIYNPSFSIFNEDMSRYNYLKWGNSYYYINDCVSTGNDQWDISCKIDVLATFKSYITSTSAYVVYASTGYDNRIVDSRFSTVDHVSYKETSTGFPDGAGTYIMDYSTKQATYGFTGVCYLSYENARQVARTLASTEMAGFLDQIAKQLESCYDAVNSMRYVPFSWKTTGDQVSLGGYDTGIACGKAQTAHNYSFSVSIPWQFSDFRNLSPYTSLLLYLPGYGFAELNPNDFVDQSSISIKLCVDGITGAGTYKVGKVMKCDCNFSQSIGVGKNMTNVLGVMGSAVGAVSSALDEKPMGVAGNIAGLVASATRSVGTTGFTSGLSSFELDKSIRCITICHNTNQEPTSVASTLGLNVRKVLKLSGIEGFVQTQNASVSAPTSQENIEAINNYLNGGVYIE